MCSHPVHRSSPGTIRHLDPTFLGRRHDPGDVVAAIFGAPLPEAGVVHPAALVPRDGRHHVLAIREDSPRSLVDSYVLQAVRAWADVILTSGPIVREEPDLSYDLDAPTGPALRSLAAWPSARPTSVAVLSSGRGLGPDLPVWRRGHRFVLFTDAGGAARVAEWAPYAGVEVVAVDEPGPRSLLAWARQRFGGPGRARISVELGPSSSAALYPREGTDEEPLVDRLLLSEVHAPVTDDLLVGEFLAEVRLEDRYRPGTTRRHHEWTFTQWQRR